MTKDLSLRGVKTLYVPVAGLHWIDIARDVLTHLFLQSDCTHMLQIDVDLGFPADAAWQMLEREVPVIGGVYPLKTDLIQGVRPKCDPRGQVIGLPGGFLMVEREVITAMSRDLPRYGASTLDYGYLEVAPLFTRRMEATRYVGEDYAFCERARQAGFKLVAAEGLRFDHVGWKTWSGGYGA